jgi:transposase-like protein
MKDYPEDMAGVILNFRTEESCLSYLEHLRWPDGYQCGRCNGSDFWRKTRGRLQCRACRHETSVTAGTLFQDTRKPLRLWFQAIWYVVSQKNGVSALGLQRALGLGSYQTAWDWLHKLRRAMVRPNRDKLSGIIEVDETFVGGERAGPRGGGAKGKSLVFIAVEVAEHGIGRIRLQVIPNASGPTLIKAVQECVTAGSTVLSDGWDGYNRLPDHGYTHKPLTHAQAGKGDATPLAHRVASLLKRWWLGTHQGAISPEHLRYYLDEFTFRFNRRTSRSRGKLFLRLFEQATHIDPVNAKNLKHKI